MKTPARFPLPLKPDDLIQVISPAGPVGSDKLQKGVARLEEWGYRVKLGSHALDHLDYLAGNDDDRLEDLVEALSNEEIRGIFCSRGGYGTMRLLPGLPWEMLRKIPPKTFVGFSDIGAFQLALLERVGWGSFSGPQVAHGLGGSLNEPTIRHLRGMIEGSSRSLGWHGSQGMILQEVSPGAAAGIIVPICLSILLSLTGTPFQPNLEGCIVCLEDVEEPLYKIDRMLWQIGNTGILDKAAAIILGKFSWQNKDISSDVNAITADMFSKVSLPIWAGLPYGHVNDHLTIPVGAECAIDSDGCLKLMAF